MPTVNLKTMNFPGASGVANGVADWDVPWPELVWAAISVGKGSLAHITQFGQFSMFEIIYRTAILYANLLESPDGSFGRSDAYDGLDPSEKSAISYFLGLTLTKAFVAQHLNVPWLMHLDVYRRNFGVNLRPGERPDLFGEDVAGRWVVAESKGRTNGHDSGALIKAKSQASQVTSIGGAAPHLSIGLVASFSSGKLSLVVDDPPVDTKTKGVRLDVSRAEFRETYYRPITELLETFPSQEERVDGQRVRVVRSDSSDIYVGISEDRMGLAPIEELRRAVIDRDRNSYLGPDGLYVRLGSSWRQDVMQLQPQERRAMR